MSHQVLHNAISYHCTSVYGWYDDKAHLTGLEAFKLKTGAKFAVQHRWQKHPWQTWSMGGDLLFCSVPRWMNLLPVYEFSHPGAPITEVHTLISPYGSLVHLPITRYPAVEEKRTYTVEWHLAWPIATGSGSTDLIGPTAAATLRDIMHPPRHWLGHHIGQGISVQQPQSNLAEGWRTVTHTLQSLSSN